MGLDFTGAAEYSREQREMYLRQMNAAMGYQPSSQKRTEQEQDNLILLLENEE